MSDTRYLEYANAREVRVRLEIAIAQLQIARRVLSVLAGEQRKGVEFCDDAMGARRSRTSST